MQHFDRITWKPSQMNGQPCIRGMRLTVRRVVEAVALYPDRNDLFRNYPELEPEDVRQPWHSQQRISSITRQRATPSETLRDAPHAGQGSSARHRSLRGRGYERWHTGELDLSFHAANTNFARPSFDTVRRQAMHFSCVTPSRLSMITGSPQQRGGNSATGCRFEATS
jgi:uncharacterized protein (DUF433 family)